MISVITLSPDGLVCPIRTGCPDAAGAVLTPLNHECSEMCVTREVPASCRLTIQPQMLLSLLGDVNDWPASL
jgi:hypothetical protein